MRDILPVDSVDSAVVRGQPALFEVLLGGAAAVAARADPRDPHPRTFPAVTVAPSFAEHTSLFLGDAARERNASSG